MSPGIFRLRTVRFAPVMPVRLTICLPTFRSSLAPSYAARTARSSRVPENLPEKDKLYAVLPPASGNSNTSPKDAHSMLE
jgi:hypothetical protein